MYDLHTHTILSDGELIASELVQRYIVKGCKGLVISDHVDASTIDSTVPQIVSFCKQTEKKFLIPVLPGCELTHLPLGTYKDMVARAKSFGARLVIVHGETIVEPVAQGTNKEAVLSGADVIAHPGLIDVEVARMACDQNVALEITSRGGHSYTNGHVVRTALETGAKLVFSTDAHSPYDLVDSLTAMRILRGAGLSEQEALEVLAYTEKLFKSKII